MRLAGQPAKEDGEPRSEAPHPVDPVLRLSDLIICAYVSRSVVARRDLPSVIISVGDKMRTISTTSVRNTDDRNISTAAAKAPIPAVPVNQSVFDDYIICLEDGSRYKSLTRHLRSSYEMSPDDYRAKWDLPAHYPMTAPAYSRRRSKISKAFQLKRRAGVKPTTMTLSKCRITLETVLPQFL